MQYLQSHYTTSFEICQGGKMSNWVKFKVGRAAKGFAFGEMATAAAAEETINRFDRYSLDNRAIFATMARPRAERSGGGPTRY
jgi:hypothetical protein